MSVGDTLKSNFRRLTAPVGMCSRSAASDLLAVATDLTVPATSESPVLYAESSKPHDA